MTEVGGRTGLLLLLLFMLAAPAASSAQETVEPSGSSGAAGPAGEGALFLLLPTGAQAVALGRAMTALPSQEGAFWNPAGLGELEESRILVSRGEHLAGRAVAFSLLLARPSLATIGLSYQLLDVGDQDHTDRQGNVIGKVSFRDHLAVASFASRPIDAVSAGFNLKLVQRRISCRGRCVDRGITATTFALDAGIQTRPIGSVPLRFGAMLAHAGPDLQVMNAEQADPLPTRVRVSWAYDVAGNVAPHPDLELWLTAELEERWRNPGSPSVYFGGELTAGRTNLFYVRAGYEAGQTRRNRGVAAGAGLRYDGFDVSLAKSLSRSTLTGESQPVHVTVGLLFD